MQAKGKEARAKALRGESRWLAPALERRLGGGGAAEASAEDRPKERKHGKKKKDKKKEKKSHRQRHASADSSDSETKSDAGGDAVERPFAHGAGAECSIAARESAGLSWMERAPTRTSDTPSAAPASGPPS